MKMRTLGLGGLIFAGLAGSGILLAPFAGAGAPVVTIWQKNRAFSESRIEIARGTTVRFTNRDEFLHQIYATGDGFAFDSDEQAPGAEEDVEFAVAGSFDIRCGIHPKMQLRIEVAR